MNYRLGIAFLLLCTAAAPTTEVTEKTVEQLIQSLGASSRAARDAAQQALASRGADIRDALLAAKPNADPETSRRIQQLLATLPKFRSDDPPLIKELLANFNASDLATQQQILRQIANQSEEFSASTLLRLLNEEESEPTRWAIARELTGLHRPATRNRLRELPEEHADAPVLIMLGWAWMQKDQEKAARLFHRAIDMEMARMTNDLGQLRPVFNWLQGRAELRKDYDEAARVLRWRIMRDTNSDPDQASIAFALIALHAEHGPLKELDRDLQTYGQMLGNGQKLYCLARHNQRRGFGELADAYATAAFLSTSDARERTITARVLVDHRWLNWAEDELNQVVSTFAEGPNQHLTYAHLLLSRVHADRGDLFQTAEQLRLSLERRDENTRFIRTDAQGNRRDWNDRDAWAEMHWRYLQAAMAKKDMAEVDRRLKEIKGLEPSDSNLAIELVPLMKERKLEDDAKAFFQRAYGLLAPEADAAANDPELQNNLAWLCARCDERLNEALDRSKRAVSIDPERPAYLDTLAEVHFRLGNQKEAIELEEKAIQLQPGDKFMTEQLERFKKGK